jgi:hypothetical protein
MEVNSIEQERLIKEKLKYYGRFSRREDSKKKRNINNKVFGYRKGESINIELDSENNPILISKDGTKFIDSIKSFDIDEEGDFDINSNQNFKKQKKLKKKKNRIFDSESEISFSYENKKREKNNNKNNKNNINNSNQKKEKPKCVVCNFEFFSFMTENEINQHINACLDGNGEKNIQELLKTKDMIEQQINLKKEEENINCCPICHKVYKNLQNHTKTCVNKNLHSDSE